MKALKFVIVIWLLSALFLTLTQIALAEEIVVSEHNINLHILKEKNVFETVSYTTESNKSFSGTIKAWIPDGAINISINEIAGELELIPLNFQRQGNIASFNLTILPLNSTSISISYEMTPGFFEKQFEFNIETFYPVESLSAVIISQSNFNITTSDNVGFMMPSRYVQAKDYYITVLANQRVLNGQEKISIKFAEVKATLTPTRSPEPPGQLDISPYLFTAMLLIVALAIVLVFFWRGKKKTPGDDAEYKAESEALSATLKEIEEDYKAGDLSEEEYKKLKGEYEAREASAEKKSKKQR